MKRTVAVLAVILGLVAAPALAVPITGLYNTGQGLPGTIDPHYVLTGPSGVTGPFVIDPSTFPALWVQTPGWIGVNNGNAGVLEPSDPETEYVYTLTFDLTGLNLSGVVITGSWATDNRGQIYVNGDPTGERSGLFLSLSSFSLTSGNATFFAGLNTLEFHVTNTAGFPIGNPTGLLVTNLSGTDGETPDPVPEPTTLLLLGGGLIGLARARRRARP